MRIAGTSADRALGGHSFVLVKDYTSGQEEAPAAATPTSSYDSTGDYSIPKDADHDAAKDFGGLTSEASELAQRHPAPSNPGASSPNASDETLSFTRFDVEHSSYSAKPIQPGSHCSRMMKSIREMWRPPLLRGSALLFTVWFCLSFGWYGLVLWVPELFRKVCSCTCYGYDANCAFK